MTSESLPHGVRYVIGLDIGDGESSLGWAPLDSPEPAQIYARPRSGERSIVTAMAHLPARQGHRRIIGDEAVTSPGARQFSVNFKQAPDPSGLETPDAVIFAQTLLTEFQTHHADLLRQAVVFVGHPTGWSDASIAAYGRHLAVLGLPVRLMPESQSALLHVRDRGRDGRQLERVLVIDIGSSTTDCTIVEDMTPRNLAVGAGLGCRQIDDMLAALVREGLRYDTPLMDALSADGGGDLLLLACRWAKEAQFSGVSRRILNLQEACAERFRPIVARAWPWLMSHEIPHLVSAPGGWADRFRAVLDEVADALGGVPPNLVVLTGGGSRMPVAGRLCREAFPSAVIEHDNEPAFTVTRGLVSNGRHRANVARFRHDISALMRAPETEQRVRTEAVAALEQTKQALLDELRQAGSTPYGLTPNMERASAHLAEQLSSYLSERVEDVCRQHGLPDDRIHLVLMLPDLFTDRLDRVVERVEMAERVAEFSREVMVEAGKASAKTWYLWRQLVKTRFVPALGVAGVVAAVGGLAAGSGWAADRAAWVWIKRLIRLTELSADDLDQIVGEAMAVITEQTNDRVRDLERLLV